MGKEGADSEKSWSQIWVNLVIKKYQTSKICVITCTCRWHDPKVTWEECSQNRFTHWSCANLLDLTSKIGKGSSAPLLFEQNSLFAVGTLLLLAPHSTTINASTYMVWTPGDLSIKANRILQSHGLYCIVARAKGSFLHIAHCTLHIAQCTCPWTGTTAEPVSQTLTVCLYCVLNYWNKRFKIALLQVKALVSLFCCIFRKLLTF